MLVGLEFGGAVLTPADALAPGMGQIGAVTWGARELLRDLELRLGIQTRVVSEAVRIARWAARMGALESPTAFFSRSFAVDALGTARALLRLRDSLVEAGWRGEAIANSGPRLQAIVKLEHQSEPSLPSGFVDRLAAVTDALAHQESLVYEQVTLAEPIELWPSLWQSIFNELERSGTRFEVQRLSLPGASAQNDLGRVQAALLGNPSDALQGDGSFILLTAPTAGEAACVTAAIAAELPPAETVIIRAADAGVLDNALTAHGLRAQGWSSVSPWRAALQVLSLALELAFDPKDPQRVLELITLPIGPFSGWSGGLLAKALTESPGIGSPVWERAKAHIAEVAEGQSENPDQAAARRTQLLERIHEWLEQPGHDAEIGAPKAQLLSVIERVRGWLVHYLPNALGDATVLTAIRQTDALRAAIDSDVRSSLSLVEVRRIAEFVLDSGTVAQLIDESAGRIDHVDRAACLQVPRANVIWWSFVADGAGHSALPWRRHELAALLSLGLRFPDPKARLSQHAVGWRRAILAATERVVLVAPNTSAGERLSRHPLWDEIVARAKIDDATRQLIAIDAGTLRIPKTTRPMFVGPPLTRAPVLSLPGGIHEWSVPSEDVIPVDQLSTLSLTSLLGCPLRWALGYRAGLNSGGHALPPLFIVNGTLGHRLIEVLHDQDAFALPESPFREQAETELDALFRTEGAILLRAGMAFERSQLRRQLVDAVVELARLLKRAELRIIAVERELEASWRGLTLVGRIDLLVEGPGAVEAIIDVKWGLSSYRDLLREGQALQLAIYVFAHATARDLESVPDASYFSLKQQKLFGLPSLLLPNVEDVHGPQLDDTWRKIERSVENVDRVIKSGRFAVTGLRRSLPLLSSLDVATEHYGDHFALSPKESCKYCLFDTLCGLRWERGTDAS
ncbi:MAG TPA: PD-(D/E)XK nuclease family protein [Polyangiaceae bacterium]|nr:PD-(D/E)XK nuclease family protein [Polyangiaceae bacterium]